MKRERYVAASIPAVEAVGADKAAGGGDERLRDQFLAKFRKNKPINTQNFGHVMNKPEKSVSQHSLCNSATQWRVTVKLWKNS